MKRILLATAAATTPLLLAAAPVMAQVTISTATTSPVKTSTASSGGPSDVTVSTSGSIKLGSPGTALTLDSNNKATNSGTLSASNQDNSVGFDILGGVTGEATNTGSITLNETYTPPTDPNQNGLYTGAFAQGSNRVGILVSLPSTGATVFVGDLVDTGDITVNGNNSEGVSIQAPISGNFEGLTVTAANGSTPASVTRGAITVVGQNAIGLQVTPTGGIGGNARITGITATGPGAQGAQIDGAVGGYVNFSGAVAATGYRVTSRSSNPLIQQLYSQEELQQGGAAVTIGGNVGAGVIVSAPPPVTSTTNLDVDGDGVPDASQGTGTIISYGSAPAMQIGGVATTSGGTAPAITLGAYTASSYLSPYSSAAPGQTFGLVVQGTISGQGLFDQLTSPFLLAPVSATGLQIGGQILVTPQLYTFGSNYQPTSATPAPAVYLPSGQVNIVGGLYNDGSIGAAAYQADATAIHIGAGASVPTIYNEGSIAAVSTQVNSSTGVTKNGNAYNGVKLPDTPAPTPVTVTAIQIDAGASVSTITNNSGVLAEITGNGGVGGQAIGIVDKSGTLQTIDNTGSIQAILNQTDNQSLMPINSPTGASNTVAIDMSASSLPQTIDQGFTPLAASTKVTAYAATSSYSVGQIVSYSGNLYLNTAAAAAGVDPVDYPSNWREIGSASPSIVGDIYMGSGPDTLNVQAGSVTARTISMGAGLNTVTVNGSPGAPVSVGGAFTEQAGGAFQISVNNGVLTDLNPALGQAATSINIGANGTLVVAVDPANNRNTEFVTSVGAVIAPGGEIGVTMASLQTNTVQTYTVIAGAQGTISAPQLGPTSVGSAPFLYSASSSFVASDPANGGDSEVQLTVSRKTAAQLGFNASESSAFDAVLNDLSAPTAASPAIAQALLSQTSSAGLRSVYDQLLPNQGEGLFQALDAAAEKVGAFIGVAPDNAVHMGGTSLWVQEVNEHVSRATADTLGSSAQLFGVVAGYERMGASGGALGATLGYYNAQESTTAAQLGARYVGSLIEGSLYFRRSFGKLSLAGRVGGGFGWFNETRVFAYQKIDESAHANFSGEFLNGHFGATYEVKLFGPYYARPEVSLDYLALHQGGYKEQGSDPLFNLTVASGTQHQFSGQGDMVLGRQWGKASWFRTEFLFGYREVISGEVGDTTAEFAGGTPFTLLGDPDKGGWMTAGFSLRTGSAYSYLALEGELDFRKGQRRYDLRVAGRSVF